MDLPAPTIGDEVVFIDYAGTFDSNTLTIGKWFRKNCRIDS